MEYTETPWKVATFDDHPGMYEIDGVYDWAKSLYDTDEPQAAILVNRTDDGNNG